MAGNMIGRISTTGAFIGYPIPANDWFSRVHHDRARRGTVVYPARRARRRHRSPHSRWGTHGVPGQQSFERRWRRHHYGTDGALWFTEPHEGGNFIGRITTAGVVTQYPAPGPTDGITGGRTGRCGLPPFMAPSSLGRITTAGTVTTYPLQTLQPAGLQSIAAGSDGALWIVDGPGWIGRAAISPAPAPALSASAPPLGAPGVSYSTTLSASGGTPPYSNWTVSSGSLPPGLMLEAATGAITGIATTAGTFNFGVTFQDSTGTTSAEQAVSITIIVPNPGLSMVGSMPHLAAEENWTTTFTLINKTAVQSPARLSLLAIWTAGRCR